MVEEKLTEQLNQLSHFQDLDDVFQQFLFPVFLFQLHDFDVVLQVLYQHQQY
jgi:hypothetical protein